jgi:hypothetical protein
MDNDRFFTNGFVSDLPDTSTSTSDVMTENKEFSKKYTELMRQEGNQLDARNQYKRTVMQTVNILVATAVLFGLIYNQK